MIKKILIFLLVSALVLSYVPPVLRTWINSTFGELRLGFKPHFHMGVDFSTWEGNPRSGIKIVAVEDGELERIEIDPDDLYGCVVVIRHKDYKTVYAHLSGFSKDMKTSTGAGISAILRDLLARYGVSEDVWKMKLEEMRKEAKRIYGNAYEPFMNEDELYPLCFKEGWKGKPKKITVEFPAGEVKIKQGQVIGYSGASGNVQGPHCHFEVRSLDEEISYDPLSVYPEMVRWIERPVKNEIVLEKIAIDGKVYDYSKDEVYEFEGEYPRISILAYSDYSVKWYRYRLGLKRISMSVNGRKVYEIDFGEISREDFYKAFYVYDEELSSLKGKYEAWYDLFPKGKIGVVRVNEISRFPDSSVVEIELFDYFGNVKKVELKLRRK